MIDLTHPLLRIALFTAALLLSWGWRVDWIRVRSTIGDVAGLIATGALIVAALIATGSTYPSQLTQIICTWVYLVGPALLMMCAHANGDLRLKYPTARKLSELKDCT